MLNLLGLGAGFYAAVSTLAYAFQKSLIYPAPRLPIEPHVEGATLLEVPNEGGPAISVLHLPAEPGRKTIVHFHGNGEELADLAGLTEALGDAGLGVFAVEYPGYGLMRDATPSEAALYQAAERALWFLREALRVPLGRTVLQGQSLGSGVAVEMARRGHGERLVLLSPYTSLPRLFKHFTPFLPIDLIVRDRYDNYRKAPSVEIPVYIIHGQNDPLVPVEMGQALFERFPDATLHVVPGAHHNDLFAFDGYGIIERIENFVHDDLSDAPN